MWWIAEEFLLSAAFLIKLEIWFIALVLGNLKGNNFWWNGQYLSEFIRKYSGIVVNDSVSR